MLNLFLVVTNATSPGSLEVDWAVEPASACEPGAVSVHAVLPEELLLFVADQDAGPGEMTASYEAVAMIDEDLLARSSGTDVHDGRPVEVTLELDGVTPGVHDLSVTLSDRESGRSWTREHRIEVPLSGEGWTCGALAVHPGWTARPGQDFRMAWEVFPPGDVDTLAGVDDAGGTGLRAAYAVRGESGGVYREGWLDLTDGEDVLTATASIGLSGLEPGEYQLLAVVLLNDDVVGSASGRLELLEDWDVWGHDPGETADLIWPIARPSELSALEESRSVEERLAVMREFWRSRDPSPSTEGNEYLDAYLARLDTVDDRYSYLGRSGVITDRGRVYLLYGEPDEVQDYPFETESVPYQIWTYYSPSVRIVFIDSDGTGVYELYNGWQEVLGAVDG